MNNEKRKIIAVAINKAETRLKWDCLEYKKYEGGTSQLDWIQTLITRINEAASKNEKFNCVLCSCEASTLISDLAFFNPVVSEETQSNDFYKSGDIAGKYSVFIDAYLPANFILVLNEKDMLDMTAQLECAIVLVDHVQDLFEIKEN